MLARIKALRNEQNLSQQKLGDAIEMSQQSINKYENHDIEPDITTLKKIATFFGVSIDYILEFSNVRERMQPRSEADLSNEENQLVDDYRKLGDRDRSMAKAVIKRLLKG